MGDIYKSGDPPAAFDKKGFQPILLSGMMPLEVGEGGCGMGSIVPRARLIITCTSGVGAAAQLPGSILNNKGFQPLGEGAWR